MLLEGIKSLFLSISLIITGTVYTIIPKLYKLFEWLATFKFLDDNFVHNVWNNIYVFVAVIVLFAIAIKLISTMVNPDTLSDNKKGVRAYYFRAVTAVLLIFIIPILFTYSFDLQEDLLSNNFLTTRIFGYELKEGTNIGQVLAWEAFSSFCTPYDEKNITINGNKVTVEITPDSTQKNNYQLVQQDMSNLPIFLYTMKVAESNIVNQVLKAGKVTVNYGFNYQSILCPLVGILIAYEMLLLCMDTMFRSAKLALLELMLPIVLGAYVFNPDILKKWAKEFFSTYLSLFFKIIAIGFMVISFSEIPNLINKNGKYFDDWLLNGLFQVIFIIALLQLVKKIPDLINTLFGIQIKPQGGIKGRLGEMAGIGAIAQKAWTSLGGVAKGIGATAAIGSAAGLGFLAKKGFSGIADNNNGKLGDSARKLRTTYGKLKNGKVGAGANALVAGVQSKGKGTGKAMLNAWNASPAVAATAQVDRNRRQQNFYELANLDPTGKSTKYKNDTLNSAYVRDEKIDRKDIANNVNNRLGSIDDFKNRFIQKAGNVPEETINRAVEKEIARRNRIIEREYQDAINIRNTKVSKAEPNYWNGKSTQLKSDLENVEKIIETLALDPNAVDAHKDFLSRLQAVSDYIYAQGKQNRAISFVDKAYQNASMDPSKEEEAKALSSISGWLSASSSYVKQDPKTGATIAKTNVDLYNELMRKIKGLDKNGNKIGPDVSNLFAEGTYKLALSDIFEFGSLTSELGDRGVGGMKSNIEANQELANSAKKVIEAAYSQLKGAEGEAIKSMSGNILAEIEVKTKELAEVKAKQEFVANPKVYHDIAIQEYDTPVSPIIFGGPTGGNTGGSNGGNNGGPNGGNGGGFNPAPGTPVGLNFSSDNSTGNNGSPVVLNQTINNNTFVNSETELPNGKDNTNDIINTINKAKEEDSVERERVVKAIKDNSDSNAKQVMEQQRKTQDRVDEILEHNKKKKNDE